MMAVIPALAETGSPAPSSGSNGHNSHHGHNGSTNTSSERAAPAAKSALGGGKGAGKGAARSVSGSHGPNASSRASPAVGAHLASTHSGSSKSKSSHANANGSAHPVPSAPLSSMVNAPLDLNSVERRGQPTASREPSKRKNRPHGLEEAPTYRPTEEEWRDPMEYMRKITPEAREYGICKIIPPDSWNPPFAIDTQRFHFQTRKQELNCVEGSTRMNLTYLEGLVKFHKNLGNNLTRLPYVDKKPLDLYQLKKAVDSRGGFDMVCKLKKWAEIGRDLGYSGKIMSSLSTSLKNSYQKWLCPYEDYLRVAKPGVHQQLEIENGGPYVPSPGASPMKRSNVNTPSSARGDSPAQQAGDNLHTSLPAVTGANDRDTPVTSSGGFTPANAASRNGSPFTPNKSDQRLAPTHLLKRQLSNDTPASSVKDDQADDEDDGSGRRSKRVKKETVPRVAGSHMSLLRPPQPRTPRDDKSDPRESCEQCAKGEEAGFLILCESCDHAYHGKCLDPPITIKPESEWNCPRCLVGDGQYGFEDGGVYSLKQFQEKASEFKQSYFQKNMPYDKINNCHRPVTEDDVEQEFWRLVSSIDDTVEVEYGADIHCTTHGSGFPTIEKNPDDPYSTDPWNLNLLPLHPESLFRYIKSDISGMTVPWVYVGMIFSTFCWHNEDHYSYSANYQHFGATKTWYGIPGADAEKFEAAMKEAVPDLFETQPDLLFQLVTLLPPEKLKRAGVRVYAVDQRAGQFVMTFPQAYHAGFNHGFNFNEAVNFAPCDWEPLGLAGVERLQQFRRQPCFSHDELLWTAAEEVTSSGAGPLTIQTAKWLAPALERLYNREASYRTIFMSRHLEVPHHCPLGEREHGSSSGSSQNTNCPLEATVDDSVVPEEEYQCSFCKAFTYLSRFRCLKTGKILCLQHAGFHHCCQARESSRFLGESHVLTYRKATDDLLSICNKVAEKAQQPEAWEEKYEKQLEDDATPSLKVLRGLLNEGERIPYDLPSLPMLREFVDRCNHWVEEATTYIVRKQQNRRKNERTWTSRKSIGSGGSVDGEEKERDTRNVSNIYRLLNEAVQIGFECPEIQLLQQRANAIKDFQDDAQRALAHPSTQTIDTIEKLLDEGHSFNVDVPEFEDLTRFLDELKWMQKAESSRALYMMSLEDVVKLVEEGQRLAIPAYNDHMVYFEGRAAAGNQWEKTAKELLGVESVHYVQLEALSDQATSGSIPVSKTTLAAIEQMLHKLRDAQKLISDLNHRSQDADYRNRPRYSELVALMAKIEELQAKPGGTLELEKEQKRNEDWIRKGKRVFGKTNAPLYIFKSHLEYVLERNVDCFDTLYDKPRTPTEPASREPSPDGTTTQKTSSRNRTVYCICRRVEAGMMIECEVCHEWYHGKCLKIARGKVKEDDKYTCPICDWRLKIPRDAARPDLASLMSLSSEISSLPFQPEEEQVLEDIIQGAMEFRDKLDPYLDRAQESDMDVDMLRYYLRKIEGAEILLTEETNFFRQALHKRVPIAPEAPPMIEESKSTRKPRPTKLQKMMAQFQVDDPDDLPERVRLRANSTRRRMLNVVDSATASFRPSSTIGALNVTGNSSPGQAEGAPLPTLHRSNSTAMSSSGHGTFDDVRRGRALSSSSAGDRVPGHFGMSHDGDPGAYGKPGSSGGSSSTGGTTTGGRAAEISRLLASYDDSLLKEQLLRGDFGAADVKALPDKDKESVLEILSRNPEGSRRARELFGQGEAEKAEGGHKTWTGDRIPRAERVDRSGGSLHGEKQDLGRGGEKKVDSRQPETDGREDENVSS